MEVLKFLIQILSAKLILGLSWILITIILLNILEPLFLKIFRNDRAFLYAGIKFMELLALASLIGYVSEKFSSKSDGTFVYYFIGVLIHLWECISSAGRTRQRMIDRGFAEVFTSEIEQESRFDILAYGGSILALIVFLVNPDLNYQPFGETLESLVRWVTDVPIIGWIFVAVVGLELLSRSFGTLVTIPVLLFSVFRMFGFGDDGKSEGQGIPSSTKRIGFIFIIVALLALYLSYGGSEEPSRSSQVQSQQDIVKVGIAAYRKEGISGLKSLSDQSYEILKKDTKLEHIRDCVLVDILGNMIDSAVSKQHGFPADPYFSIPSIQGRIGKFFVQSDISRDDANRYLNIWEKEVRTKFSKAIRQQ